MITAFIVSAGITLALREMDPAIIKARREKHLAKRINLILR